MSRSSSGEAHQDVHADRSLTLTLDSFAWKTLDEEAAREGLTIEDLVTFAVLYYLADADSERISRQVSRSPYPTSTRQDRTGSL